MPATSAASSERPKARDRGKLSFLVTIGRGGQDMPIDFAVLPAGDSLTGRLSLQFGEADIVGKKKK